MALDGRDGDCASDAQASGRCHCHGWSRVLGAGAARGGGVCEEFTRAPHEKDGVRGAGLSPLRFVDVPRENVPDWLNEGTDPVVLQVVRVQAVTE